MKLLFQQSGGFLGLQRGCEMEVSSLTPELRKLLAEALDRPGARPEPTTSGADLTQYSITIKESGRHTELLFDDGNVPPAFAPLLSRLAAASKPLPLK